MHYYKSATDTVPMLLLLLFSLTVLLQFQGKAVALPGSSCQRWCGDVEIIYPFGIGAGCAMKGFKLHCNKTADGRTNVTFLGTMPLLNISLLQGEIRVTHRISSMCYNQSTRNISYKEGGMNLNNPPFTFSAQRNKFTVIGFNTFAYMMGASNVLGCLAQSGPYNNLTARDGVCNGAGCCQVALTGNMSNNNLTARDGVCNGAGCCQVALTGNMSSYGANFNRRYNTTSISTTDGAEYCGYAAIMEADTFHFRTTYLNTTAFWKENAGRVPVILNWAVGSETCAVASKKADSYACRSNNSECIDSSNGPGYLCNCTEGYSGNPYLTDGCQDIDECVVDVPPRCPGHCTNIPGSYSCPNEKPPSSRTVVLGGLGIGLGIGGGTCLLLALGAPFLTHKIKLQKVKKKREKFFNQNHGLLLQQLISHNVDIGERMIITLRDLEKATNNFDSARVIGGGGHGIVFKGIIDLQVVAIKKSRIVVQREIGEFINEVAILSQVNHRNVVKLLGCCLEAEVPLLIYEFISNGTLYQHLHVEGPTSVPWVDRIRISLEVARALSYLHSATSMPIFHRDIKSSNILLDDRLTAKVSDFGASRYIPIDQTGITTAVQGTIGYLDPMYYYTGRLTDKSDVFSFGVLLIELLTRKQPFLYRSNDDDSLVSHFVKMLAQGNLFDIIDPQVMEEEDGEAEEVATLASLCTKIRGEDRPTMREVEMTLENLLAKKQHVPCIMAPRTNEDETLVHFMPTERITNYEASRQYTMEEEILLSASYPR